MRLNRTNPHVKPKLKKFMFPNGFKFIADTREQKGIFNPIPVAYKGLVEFRTVQYGDYTIHGFEDFFSIERKKISDLYSYCGIERRTKTDRKMSEFKAMVRRGGWVGLAIEATEAEVFDGFRYSARMSPEVVRQTLCSFAIKTGVHVHFEKQKTILRRWVLDHAIYFFNAYMDSKIKLIEDDDHKVGELEWTTQSKKQTKPKKTRGKKSKSEVGK